MVQFWRHDLRNHGSRDAGPRSRPPTPWRFILSAGRGKVIADSFENNPDAIEEQVEIEQERLTRAPVIIAVVSHVQPEHKIRRG